jgi:hypothetical protein
MVPRWRLPLSVRIAWTIFLAVLAATTGVVQVLDRNLPEKTLPLVHKAWLLIGLVAALSFLTFLDTAKRAFHRVCQAMNDRSRGRGEYSERDALELFLAHLRETQPDPEVQSIIDELEQTTLRPLHVAKHRKVDIPSQVAQKV